MTVRKGAIYKFEASSWDARAPLATTPKSGTVVRVSEGGMLGGHCYVETLAGNAIGLVSCKSLKPL